MPRILRKQADRKLTAIPNNLGKIRAGKRLQIKEVAIALGIGEGTYGVIESGHSFPSESIVNKICEYYDCVILQIWDDILYPQMLKRIWDQESKKEEDDDTTDSSAVS